MSLRARLGGGARRTAHLLRRERGRLLRLSRLPAGIRAGVRAAGESRDQGGGGGRGLDAAYAHHRARPRRDIIRRGVALGVDYALTVSCYQADAEGRACGRCDACRLRARALRTLAARSDAVFRRRAPRIESAPMPEATSREPRPRRRVGVRAGVRVRCVGNKTQLLHDGRGIGLSSTWATGIACGSWLLAIAVAILGVERARARRGCSSSRARSTSGPNFTWLSYHRRRRTFRHRHDARLGLRHQNAHPRRGRQSQVAHRARVHGDRCVHDACADCSGLIPRRRCSEPADPVQLAPADRNLPSLFARWFGAERRLDGDPGRARRRRRARRRSGSPRREFRQFDFLLGGIVVGLVIVAAGTVSWRLGYVAEHPDTLQEKRSSQPIPGAWESLSFVAPQAFLLELAMLWTDKSEDRDVRHRFRARA